MQQTAEPRRRLTVQEYLHAELQAEVRHEYHNGKLIAMAGDTADHSLIIGNLIREVGNSLKGTPCRVYDSNLKVFVKQEGRFYYPDTLIVCDDLEYPPEDRNHTSITNPMVIFEVLSKSTQAADWTSKFSHYARLASLREYVLVDQYSPSIQVFLRQDDGTWRLTFYRGLEAVAKLESIGIDVPLAEIYEGVSFQERA